MSLAYVLALAPCPDRKYSRLSRLCLQAKYVHRKNRICILLQPTTCAVSGYKSSAKILKTLGILQFCMGLDDFKSFHPTKKGSSKNHKIIFSVNQNQTEQEIQEQSKHTFLSQKFQSLNSTNIRTLAAAENLSGIGQV